MSHSDTRAGAPMASLGTCWPEPFRTWAAPEYPTGRGQATAATGWACPSCGRCYAPVVRMCDHCPQNILSAATGANPNFIAKQDATVPDDEDYER